MRNSADYLVRVNRGIDHILQNLDGELRLESIARAAGFSPFHFHRIFRSLVGESLNPFVKRVRLERALSLMTQRGAENPRSPSLTHIALSCGFASSADFSRCFKQHFGTAPSRFDLQAYRDRQRTTWQQSIAADDNHHQLDRLPAGLNPDSFEVRLREIPQRKVAYLRVPDPFQAGAVPQAAAKMVQWAESHGIANQVWMGYMWDDPEIVAPKNCRYDIGLEVTTKPPDDLGLGEILFPSITVAELEIRGPIELEQRGLDWLYGTWLPRSKCSPADQPCFEIWHERPFEHGLEHFELSLQLPVEKF